MDNTTDVKVQEPSAQGQTPAKDPVELPVKDQIAQAIADVQAVWKKEIAGLNKRNSELEKIVQEKELEKLSAEQQAQKKLELAAAELDKINSQTLTLKKQNAAAGKGLSPEFANFISGANDEEIGASIELISGHIESEVKKRLESERNKLFGGVPPKSGQAPAQATLQSAYDEAKKRSDNPAMIACQRQANRDGITLNI